MWLKLGEAQSIEAQSSDVTTTAGRTWLILSAVKSDTFSMSPQIGRDAIMHAGAGARCLDQIHLSTSAPFAANPGCLGSYWRPDVLMRAPISRIDLRNGSRRPESMGVGRRANLK
jgi:hypothetical protein